MAEFFDMGGFAAFIWPAYGVTALVLGGLLVVTLRRLRANRDALRALEAADIDEQAEAS